jgi:hypothetical protein
MGGIIQASLRHNAMHDSTSAVPSAREAVMMTEYFDDGIRGQQGVQGWWLRWGRTLR